MLKLSNVASVFVPAAGKVLLYAKNNNIYKKSDDGVEYLLGGVVVSSDGWVAGSNTWSYSSADSPSFVISINADMTTTLCAGMKIKLTQLGNTKYFIVTNVGAYAGGATLITVYGGTDYTLTADAISSPYYSNVRTPLGFPQNPTKWTVESSIAWDAGQSSPASGTWYNVSGTSMTIPIGLWEVSYIADSYLTLTGGSNRIYRLWATLSTGSSVESDSDFRTFNEFVWSDANVNMYATWQTSRSKTLLLTGKTIEYLLLRVGVTSIGAVGIKGSQQNTIIRARSSYL